MKKTKLTLRSIRVASFTTSAMDMQKETRQLKGGDSTDERLCTAQCPSDPYCTYGECFTQGSPYGACSDVWYC